MNIIIPMAGLGSRFEKAGFRLPKPLIKVGNIPMYQLAVNCLPLRMATKLVFVLRESAYASKLKAHIYTHYQPIVNCEVVLLKEETQGQAETVLKAAPLLDKQLPTLVHNCDTAIDPALNWENLVKNKMDGALLLFPSHEKRWSYARVDAEKREVLEVREKEVISPHASTGTYYFSDTPYLIHNIDYLIENKLKQNGEYYLSTVYKLMLQDKKVIKPFWTDKIECYGTPEDLVNSLNQLITLN